MSTPKIHLARNSLWLILSRFGTQGFATIFTVLLARRLGSAGFGEYAFIAAIVFVANTLTTFGTDMLLIREIAAKDDLSGLPSTLLIQLASSCVCIVVLWSGGSRLPNQSLEVLAALRIYSLALIPLAFYTVFTIALRGKQRMDAYTLLNLFISFLQVGAVLLFMKPESNVITLSFLLLFVQVVVALLAGAICFQLFPGFWKIWKFDLAKGWLLLKTAAPIAWLALFGMLYQKLSITMLSTMRDSTEAGIFSAAARVVEASKAIHLAVFAALYPAMAQGLAGKSILKKAYNKIESDYFKLLMAGAFTASLILFFFAPLIVRLLYGIEFLASAPILELLAWSLIPFTISSFLSLGLMARYQERLISLVMTISVLGLIVLNLWLVPLKSAEGAAWAFLTAECIQAGLLLIAGLPHYVTHRESNELSELR